MDIVFSIEEEICAPVLDKHQPVRYGDSLVLESCGSREPTFLAIVVQESGKRSPSSLHVDAAGAGRYASGDYIWTFVPAPGTKKRRGDPVSFADRVRIQIFDSRGNYRYLALIPADSRYALAARHPAAPRFVAVAEKTPSSQAMSIWSVASAPRLRAEPSGRLLPDGERAANVEFGHGNYVALINGAGYLSVAPGPYCGIHNSVSTQSDLPDSGMAVWWRAYRSVADARRSL